MLDRDDDAGLAGLARVDKAAADLVGLDLARSGEGGAGRLVLREAKQLEQ